MKFYKNIGIVITIIIFIVIGLNVFFYVSFYNQQIKAHRIIISKQAKLCGIEVEEDLNDLKNDLNFYFNKYDLYQLFKEKNAQSESVRKLRQFFIKYNDLISSIEIIDNQGNRFIFNGNSDNYFEKSFLEISKKTLEKKNFGYFDTNKNLIYNSTLKDGNDFIANLRIKIELKTYFEIIFKQYHISNQYFQSLIDYKGNITYNNLNKNILYSKNDIITKSISNNYEDLYNQTVSYNKNKEEIISAVYPINIFGFNYGLVFSETKSSIYDLVLRKTGLISFLTIMTFIVIIVVFLNLVRSLKQKEEILKQRNLDLEQLTFSSSHHLQEPLRKIILFSDRLSSKLLSDTNSSELEILKKIQTFASNMRSMLNGLLLFSEINLKGDKFTTINTNNLITEILNEKFSFLLHENKISINKLPEITGDKNQIKILFTEFITNAINFANKEKKLEISVYEGKSNRKFNQIIIKDNGIGIDIKYKHKIFEPFQQLNIEENSKRFGIGLTLVQKIIERHKSEVTIDSIDNENFTAIINFNKNLKNG
jgi:signal transduction histidine kinase